MRDAKVEVKCKLLGSMFPKKITFDGKTYRTNSYNSVLDLKIMLYIYNQYDLPRFPLEQRTRGGLRVLIHISL